MDYYHASEYLGSAFKSLEFDNEAQKKQTKKKWFDWLWDGQINSIMTEMLSASQTKEVQDCIRYYKNNKERMRYKHYRALGLEIGSGAIESAHRIVVQCRMKQSGMHWKKSNVQSIVSLRAKYLSGDWDQIIDKYLRVA